MSDFSSGRRYQVDPRSLLVTFLDTLPERERDIAKLRYGIGGPVFTEEQIARMFSTSSDEIVQTLAHIQRWLNRVDLMWVARCFQHQGTER